MREQIICWDLEDTLIDTQNHPINLGLEEIGLQWSVALTKVVKKPNIEDVLFELQKDGFTQALTTAVPTIKADRILRSIGLSSYFAGIFGREVVCPDEKQMANKSYTPVFERLGFDPESVLLSGGALVIGDSVYDQPVEPFLPSLIDRRGMTGDADLILELIKTLQTKGQGNFDTGHYRLYEEALPLIQSAREQPNVRQLVLGGTVIRLSYTIPYVLSETRDRDRLKDRTWPLITIPASYS
jgi:hypothetical protein